VEYVDLESELSKMPGAGLVAEMDGAWRWSPAPGVAFIDLLVDGGTKVYQVSMRDDYDAGLALAVLRFARERSVEIDSAKAIVGVTGFGHDGFAFDAIGAVRPLVDRMFAQDGSPLNEVIVPVFPAFHFEFSGDETEEEATYRYDRLLRTADMRRKSSPFVRLRYHNRRTRSGTSGGKWEIDEESTLYIELANLVDSPDSFVEFENWQRQISSVRWDGVLVLREGSRSREIELAELVEIVEGKLRAD
jgi:hypothetical protein